MSDVTPIRPDPPAPDDLSKPINTVHDRLNQAHATLDLIYTAVSDPGHRDLYLETLCPGTLATALHGAMTCIEEACKAVEEVSHG